MKAILLSLCLLICYGAVKAQLKPARKAGFTTRNFADSSRSNWLGNGPRPLRSVIWYPAGDGGREELINDAQQFANPVTAYHDAPIAGISKYPLILISHGAQGNAMQMRWLGYYLASRGFIAVAVNHNGTAEEERRSKNITLTDFCMWERPKDISAVLNKLLADPVFASRIDTGRIGVAGFSLGGATAIWVAGSILNMDALAKSDPNPPPQFQEAINRLTALSKTDPLIISSFRNSADSFRDKRIKAVFALAPAIGQGFTKQSLQSINVPVQITVGDADLIAPKELNAMYYTQNIPTAKKLIILPGERGHYTKPPAGNERPAELQEVSEIAYKFFKEVLKLQ
ncbi:dienelactone hydrolase family protein [Mucilaginibacter sabulilitoris]|uniref:Dienelactone hydrolase family protein n=1 Tax=Mucilaginibacter sabulilitoris TaxID=1173583 RepID=A0ABZ0TSU4_9SPHI|nr:dienelactone hydrolase family protein [Mucilaginibacter sabulilitoris]WPU96180.1 dienelactone hydrolase family protein [Mucilaginibacter sabulilitoris]